MMYIAESTTVCIAQIPAKDDDEFYLRCMRKSGTKYIWPDQAEQSWESKEQLEARLADPIPTDAREHFAFDAKELDELQKKLLKKYRYTHLK